MPTRWLMWLIGTWIVGALVGGIIEKVEWQGEDMSLLQSLVPTATANPITIMATWKHWAETLWTIATFKYSFLMATWWGTIIRYLFIGIGAIIIAQVVWNLVGMVRGAAPSSD